MRNSLRGLGTYLDVHPFLLGEGFVFVHEDAFGHGGKGRRWTMIVEGGL